MEGLGGILAVGIMDVLRNIVAVGFERHDQSDDKQDALKQHEHVGAGAGRDSLIAVGAEHSYKAKQQAEPARQRD